MRQESELRQSLREATALIVQAAEGRLSVPDFVRLYGDFYYYEALDGHEEDDMRRALLQKYTDVIEAHRKAQTTVVDVTFLGPAAQREQYLNAGRITAEEAKARLGVIADVHHLRERLGEEATRATETLAPEDQDEEMTWYSARILYETEIAGKPDDGIREESIRVLLAGSQDEALSKAKKIGRENEVSYNNDAGENVTWRFRRVLEVQDLCEETLYDGVEVFSTLARIEESQNQESEDPKSS